MNMITKGQIRSLVSAYHSIAKRDVDAICFIVSKFLDQNKTLPSLSDITHDEWVFMRNIMFPDWPHENWTVGTEFKRRASVFHEWYLEGVMGQMRMFEDQDYG